jgi:hypothetical protein
MHPAVARGTSRPVAARGPAAVLAGVALVAAGCGGDGDARARSATDAHIRQVVQGYLDAMKAQDAGRGARQVCASARATFQQRATGASGDFNRSFSVQRTRITKVSPAGDERQVTAEVTLTPRNARPVVATVVYTVHAEHGNWCLTGESVAGTAAPR